jgi:uncharacterized protein YunC (DUF1805 family)
MSYSMGKKKNTCFIYKNDLKFNEEINLEDSEFESDSVKKIYNSFKTKPKIELRIEDSKMENYIYFDLSKLDIDDEMLIKLFELERIKKILEKIEFLDLAHNKLTTLPNLKKYPNILYLSVSFNKINQDIEDNNLLELTCNDNNIKSIKSKKLTHLNASNNNIEYIDVPNINLMTINNNKLFWIPSYLNLKYLECIGNQINKIDSMRVLEELYIGENKIINISNMPKLQILNCVSNPIEKIKYFPNLKTVMSSTAKISSQYQISSISKIKADFLINLIPYE